MVVNIRVSLQSYLEELKLFNLIETNLIMDLKFKILYISLLISLIIGVPLTVSSLVLLFVVQDYSIETYEFLGAGIVFSVIAVFIYKRKDFQQGNKELSKKYYQK